MKIFNDDKTKLLFCLIFFCIAVFVLFSAFLLISDSSASSVCIFIASLFVFSVILISLYIYLNYNVKTIERADRRIEEYISGDKSARIDCNEEGELNKLFHDVNKLASILNAHAENEAHSKEFLKNTISDISHQLKTPLAALNIYNGILHNEAENMPAIQEFTELTERELDRMEVLVQNLLKITRLDAGTIRLDKKTENLYDMLSDIEKHFTFRAKQEKKHIFVEGDKEATLFCNRDWLIQAIENIVKNAFDHTGENGSIKLEWKCLPSVVRLTVSDDGSGIYPEDIHHIFKRFYRSRFSKDTQGIGLGLPLSKSVIEAHNGSIEVYSELGRGTDFVITFPITTEL